MPGHTCINITHTLPDVLTETCEAVGTLVDMELVGVAVLGAGVSEGTGVDDIVDVGNGGIDDDDDDDDDIDGVGVWTAEPGKLTTEDKTHKHGAGKGEYNSTVILIMYHKNDAPKHMHNLELMPLFWDTCYQYC